MPEHTPHSDGDTIIWISGASKGVGAGLARTVPIPKSHVINMSRSSVPGMANVPLDLTSPDSWESAANAMSDVLHGFTGEQAIFIHNAFVEGPYGHAGSVDKARVRDHLIANHAAALWLGNAFLEACPPSVNAGLVMISSLSAKIPMEGASFYSASKAGIEMWLRTVELERKRRGSGPWIIGFRLGLIDSPGVRKIAEVDPRDCPAAGATKDSLALGTVMDPDDAGRQMWSHILAPESGRIYPIATLPQTIEKY